MKVLDLFSGSGSIKKYFKDKENVEVISLDFCKKYKPDILVDIIIRERGKKKACPKTAVSFILLKYEADYAVISGYSPDGGFALAHYCDIGVAVENTY